MAATNRPDIIEADAGIVVPLEASAIAKALADLMSDSERRALMGANGRRHAADKLTWAAVARTMVGSYETY